MKIERVLYVVWQYPKYSETFVQNEIDELRSRGVAVKVVTVGSGDWDLGEGEQDVLRVPRTPALLNVLKTLTHLRHVSDDDFLTQVWAAASARAIERRLDGWQPDVVHVHFIDKPAALGIEIGRLLGAPVSVLAHARDYLCHVSPRILKERLKKLAYPFAISHRAAADLSRIAAKSQDELNVTVVRATPNFKIVSGEFSPNREYFVTVARLVEKKGIDMSLRAFAEVAKTKPGIGYIIIGSGPLEYELKALADELGLHGRVTFTGPLKAAQTQARIAQACAMVLGCRTAKDGDADGIPVVLMEAGLAGIPVITTDVGGIDELVRPNQEGWIVQPNDVSGMARAMIEVLESPETTRERVASLRKRVDLEFSAELQCQRLLNAWSNPSESIA